MDLRPRIARCAVALAVALAVVSAVAPFQTASARTHVRRIVPFASVTPPATPAAPECPAGFTLSLHPTNPAKGAFSCTSANVACPSGWRVQPWNIPGTSGGFFGQPFYVSIDPFTPGSVSDAVRVTYTCNGPAPANQ